MSSGSMISAKGGNGGIPFEGSDESEQVIPGGGGGGSGGYVTISSLIEISSVISVCIKIGSILLFSWNSFLKDSKFVGSISKITGVPPYSEIASQCFLPNSPRPPVTM